MQRMGDGFLGYEVDYRRGCECHCLQMDGGWVFGVNEAEFRRRCECLSEILLGGGRVLGVL